MPAAAFADVVPDTGDEQNQNDGLDQLARFIDGISIVDAYNRWIGKTVDGKAPQAFGGQVDNVMSRCPMKGHADNNPSTWMSPAKNLISPCQSCGFPGGGPIDLAAIAYDMDHKVHKGSRDSKAFVELQVRIGAEFGWEHVKTSDGRYVVFPPNAPQFNPQGEGKMSSGRFMKKIKEAKARSQPEPQAEPQAEPQPAQASHGDAQPEPAQPAPGTVTNISAAPSAMGDDVVYPDMDWRSVFTEDTFIREYADATSIAPVAEMYNIANALTAVGAALGREVVLSDHKPVLGNLFICLLGPTGKGKSTSHEYLEEVLRDALPYDANDPKPRGAKYGTAALTGEGLVSMFRRVIPDPRNPKWHLIEGDVRAVVEYGELSGLTNMALKQGSILKDILHDFYDGKRVVGYTTKGEGEFNAENPFCSIITTTQPDMLDALLDAKDVASGFLNRLNFFTGTPKETEAFDLSRSYPNLDRSIEMLKEIHDWASSGDPVIMTPDAVAVFNPFFRDQVRPIIESPGGRAMGRAELFLKKMLLLLAANNKERFVSPRTVEQVIMMWPYFLECYKLVGAEVNISIGNKVEERIFSILERHKAKGIALSAKQIKNKVKNKYDTDQILKAVGNLEKLGMVKRILPAPKRPGSGPGAAPTVEKFEAII